MKLRRRPATIKTGTRAAKAIAAADRGDCQRAKKLVFSALNAPRENPLPQLARAAKFVINRCGALAGSRKRKRRRKSHR